MSLRYIIRCEKYVYELFGLGGDIIVDDDTECHNVIIINPLLRNRYTL